MSKKKESTVFDYLKCYIRYIFSDPLFMQVKNIQQTYKQTNLLQRNHGYAYIVIYTA